MNHLITKLGTLRSLGARNLMRVAKYRLALRIPASPLRRIRTQLPGGPFFRPRAGNRTLPRSSGAWNGEASYFDWFRIPLGSAPPDWKSNPMTGERFADPMTEWWRIPENVRHGNALIEKIRRATDRDEGTVDIAKLDQLRRDEEGDVASDDSYTQDRKKCLIPRGGRGGRGRGGRGGPRRPGGRTYGACDRCGQQGHFKKDCPMSAEQSNGFSPQNHQYLSTVGSVLPYTMNNAITPSMSASHVSRGRGYQGG